MTEISWKRVGDWGPPEADDYPIIWRWIDAQPSWQNSHVCEQPEDGWPPYDWGRTHPDPERRIQWFSITLPPFDRVAPVPEPESVFLDRAEVLLTLRNELAGSGYMNEVIEAVLAITPGPPTIDVPSPAPLLPVGTRKTSPDGVYGWTVVEHDWNAGRGPRRYLMESKGGQRIWWDADVVESWPDAPPISTLRRNDEREHRIAWAPFNTGEPAPPHPDTGAPT